MGVFVSRIFDDLLSGAIDASHLSARRLAARLGVTTGWLYHHHGSLDGFLLEVAALGARHLLGLLTDDLYASVETLIRFEKDHPALYDLMFLRPWGYLDRALLDYSAGDALQHVWSHLANMAREEGSVTPLEDADAIMVALHGAVLLGRANHHGPDGPSGDASDRPRRAVFHILRRMGGTGSRFDTEDPWLA